MCPAPRADELVTDVAKLRTSNDGAPQVCCRMRRWRALMQSASAAGLGGTGGEYLCSTIGLQDVQVVSTCEVR